MFLINCDNKGCGKSTQAVINLEDNQVYCVACGKVISNVTVFTKNQLKNLKQIKRQKETFASRCHACGHEAMPKLVADELRCTKCNTHLVKIPKPFEILTKQAILNKVKEETEDKEDNNTK